MIQSKLNKKLEKVQESKKEIEFEKRTERGKDEKDEKEEKERLK